MEYKKRPDARRALKHPWFKQTFELAARPPFIHDDEEGTKFEEERRDTMFKADAINVSLVLRLFVCRMRSNG